MRFLTLCLLSLSVSFTAHAKKLWLDSNWHVTSYGNATYYTHVPFTKSGDVWQGEIFYKSNNQTRFKGLFNRSSLDISGVKKIRNYTFYYPDGTIERIGHENDAGDIVGEQKYFCRSGNLFRKKKYDQHQRLIYLATYDAKGNIQEEQSLHYSEHGKTKKEKRHVKGQHIVTTEQYNTNGTLISRKELRNNVLNGLNVEHTIKPESSTMVLTYQHYNHGKKQGHFTRKTLRGAILEHGNYFNDIRVGEWVSKKNGHTTITHYDRRGNKHGSYIHRTKDGKILGRGNYRQGKKIGPWLETLADRQIIENYDPQGLKHGEFKETLTNGKVVRLEHYNHGKPNGEFKRYREDGTSLNTGHYVNGKKDGDWTEIDKKSKQISHGNYSAGVRVGPWQTFAPSGYLQQQCSFDQAGRQHGFCYQFNADGSLASAEHYEHGKKDGKQYQYELGIPATISTFQKGKPLNVDTPQKAKQSQ